jgi:hypothetical protein
MKKTIQHKLLTSNESLVLEITTHKEFIECVQLVQNPFNKSKTFINPELQIEQYNTIVLKCFIAENERHKILNLNGENSMNITYKVVDEFIQENWTNGETLIQLESLFCSHFEHQFKYAIIK